MRRLFATAALLFALVPAAGVLDAQSSWDRYLPRSLAYVAQHVEGDLVQAIDTTSIGYLLAESDFPTRAQVTFAGSWRPLTAGARGTLESFIAATGLDSQVLTHFREEALFREGDKELWIPVQQPMAARLRSSVQPGAQITIFAMWIGAIQNGSRLQSVFIGNEFITSAFVREIDLGANGKLALGAVLERRSTLLAAPEGNLHHLRPGTFTGAESIAVELTSSYQVRVIHFGYASGTSFEEYLANSRQVLGEPIAHATRDIEGGTREVALWQDDATVAELENTTTNGISRVRLRLIDRELAGR